MGPLLVVVASLLVASSPLPVRAATAVVTTIFVDHSGRGQFKTIQEAVNAVPSNNNQWIRIHVAAGVYEEQVRIPVDKGFILLEGEGRDQTSIEWGGVTMAPALAAIIWADKAAFYDCSFVGFQDTLCDMSGRHYFKDCRIEGAVDFIFGIGQSIYERCTLVSLGDGWITAHGRSNPFDPSGFVFKHCTITGIGKTHLGRAWGPLSTVVFFHTFMSDIIVPEGWQAWFNARHLSEITYVESSCTGPGSNTSSRVFWEKQLTNADLLKYISMAYINHDGWLEKFP
ncbi:unnamed protein product [Spirodela intermedia]|uniref:Pectinesterase n=1 Tax=Spirodela intermedia TaxID=51605 RepID=A0A7I8I8X2_SPIIN|nr:unnamed protein product [Spirodela intermedia]CAA6654105.1 unnamed protein product [Spirodela intermedia]